MSKRMYLAYKDTNNQGCGKYPWIEPVKDESHYRDEIIEFLRKGYYNVIPFYLDEDSDTEYFITWAYVYTHRV